MCKHNFSVKFGFLCVKLRFVRVLKSGCHVWESDFNLLCVRKMLSQAAAGFFDDHLRIGQRLTNFCGLLHQPMNLISKVRPWDIPMIFSWIPVFSPVTMQPYLTKYVGHNVWQEIPLARKPRPQLLRDVPCNLYGNTINTARRKNNVSWKSAASKDLCQIRVFSRNENYFFLNSPKVYF